jgi:hypothetical protein
MTIVLTGYLVFAMKGYMGQRIDYSQILLRRRKTHNRTQAGTKGRSDFVPNQNALNGFCAADHGRVVVMGCPKLDGAEIQVLISKKG